MGMLGGFWNLWVFLPGVFGLVLMGVSHFFWGHGPLPEGPWSAVLLQLFLVLFASSLEVRNWRIREELRYAVIALRNSYILLFAAVSLYGLSLVESLARDAEEFYALFHDGLGEVWARFKVAMRGEFAGLYDPASVFAYDWPGKDILVLFVIGLVTAVAGFLALAAMSEVGRLESDTPGGEPPRGFASGVLLFACAVFSSMLFVIYPWTTQAEGVVARIVLALAAFLIVPIFFFLLASGIGAFKAKRRPPWGGLLAVLLAIAASASILGGVMCLAPGSLALPEGTDARPVLIWVALLFGLALAATLLAFGARWLWLRGLPRAREALLRLQRWGRARLSALILALAFAFLSVRIVLFRGRIEQRDDDGRPVRIAWPFPKGTVTQIASDGTETTTRPGAKPRTRRPAEAAGLLLALIALALALGLGAMLLSGRGGTEVIDAPRPVPAAETPTQEGTAGTTEPDGSEDGVPESTPISEPEPTPAPDPQPVPGPPEDPPPPAPEPVPDCKAGPDEFTVRFAFDADGLDEAARGEIARALEAFRARALACAQGSPDGAARLAIDVVGHADRAGPEAYNQGLSERRARAVAEALRAGGVPAEALRTLEGRGEREPAQPTPDGTRAAENRRAAVTEILRKAVPADPADGRWPPAGGPPGPTSALPEARRPLA